MNNICLKPQNIRAQYSTDVYEIYLKQKSNQLLMNLIQNVLGLIFAICLKHFIDTHSYLIYLLFYFPFVMLI